MIHAHLTSLVLSLLLFIIVVVLQGKGKNSKILQMVLRASYLLIIVTGFMLFFPVYKISLFLYILKAVFGIAMIGVFEIIISWNEKGKSTGLLWIVCTVVLVIVVLLGITLPLGMKYI
ncbi:YisL family protein [Neobacillus sp. LXY-4]|uniref:YisL family protein n=1 Tax=Neobacillus sp. LXY-4 TaxID=3379826 RepID=UPI003EDE7C6F